MTRAQAKDKLDRCKRELEQLMFGLENSTGPDAWIETASLAAEDIQAVLDQLADISLDPITG